MRKRASRDLPELSRLQLTRLRQESDREEEKRPLDLRLILRLLRYLEPYRTRRNWLLVFVVLRAIQLPAIAWLTGAVINGPISGHWGDAWVIGGAVAFLLLAGLTQWCFHYRWRLALELGEAVIHDLHTELFRHLQRMPMGFYHRTKIGRIISRMTSDCEALRVGVQEVLFVSLVGGGQMIVAAAFMLYYDWVLFSVVLAMTPLIWGLNRIFRDRLSKVYRQVQESFSRVTSTLAESVNGIRVTQGFVRQDLNALLFQELVIDHAHVNMQAARTSGIFLPMLELTSQVFIAALLAVGGYRVLQPGIQMPIGDLIQFFFLANIFFNPIQILGNQYNQALTAMAGAERVFGLLDTPPDWEDPADAVPLPRILRQAEGPLPRELDRPDGIASRDVIEPPAEKSSAKESPARMDPGLTSTGLTSTGMGAVEFRNVSFGYQPDRLVLSDLNFAAPAGSTVALVGHTGSGKTSIINLIAKFYLPTAGQVLIDGRDSREIATDSLHDQLGIVLQHNFLFTGTLLENIRVGKPGATEQEARESLSRLGCLGQFEALPDGLQTVVGERGSGLSVGQRQLICFARALIADPLILVLDEATSAVDSLTELRLQRALARLMYRRTSFVVAHRLSTIEQADLVLVLDQGRIIERGTHPELLALGGVYAQMVDDFRGTGALPRSTVQIGL